MATLEQLETQIKAALSTWLPTDTWSEEPQGPLSPDGYQFRVKIASSEEVSAGSNLVRRIAEASVQFNYRVTDMWNMEAAEETINIFIDALTQIAFWTDLAAVSERVLPEIEIESEPERIGHVLTVTFRARVALEG